MDNEAYGNVESQLPTKASPPNETLSNDFIRLDTMCIEKENM